MIRELFRDGRWMLNRGALRNPCEGAGCKRWIEKGEFYWRESGSGGMHFCFDCVPSGVQGQRPCGDRSRQ